MVKEARDAGLDTFITGEGAHHTYFDAMEFGVNVFHAGHYATETVGVRALAEHLGAKFGLPHDFPRPSHGHVTGDPILQLRDIHKRFGTVQALTGAEPGRARR